MTNATRVTAPRGGNATETTILVMVGAPGAGKGTQTALLGERLGLPAVSTGDLFRAALREGSPLGVTVRPYLERGELVPDAVTIAVIADRLAQPDAARGVILDGFPRTRAQAEALDRLCAGRGTRVMGALYVEVELEMLVDRLSGRRVCSGPEAHVYHVRSRAPRVEGRCDSDGTALDHRVDDRPETVRRRLEGQMAPMFEVIDHYSERGVLSAVRGDQTVEAVTTDLLAAIERCRRRPGA